MEITKLKTSDTADFKSLIEIFNHVFENNLQVPDTTHLNKVLSNPDFMVFVVKTNGKVVGGLTVYVLHQYYNHKPQAYIYDVGISPDYQRKGFGKALMQAVCNFCEQNGFESGYVEAERDDTDAVNFYRKTKPGNEMNAVHFTYTFSA